MSLPGIDLSSFQGDPGAWRAYLGGISWAAMKATELAADGTRYADPDLAADAAALREAGKGRIFYAYGHPGALPAETVAFFAATVAPLIEPGDGIALDLEVTDGRNPAQVCTWARMTLRQLQALLRRTPLLYTYPDFAAGGNCSGCGSWPLWLSDPSMPAGHPRVPAPWSAWAIHQFSISGPVDRDLAAWTDLAAMSAALGEQVPRPPAPVTRPQEPEMILVQVDKATVPAGTAWPGVFLLDAGAALHHVTAGAADGTDNVKSYQAAGIPGPVTITWDEYQARSAPGQ